MDARPSIMDFIGLILICGCVPLAVFALGTFIAKMFTMHAAPENHRSIVEVEYLGPATDFKIFFHPSLKYMTNQDGSSKNQPKTRLN